MCGVVEKSKDINTVHDDDVIILHSKHTTKLIKL